MRSNEDGATFTETVRRTQIVDVAIDTIAELGYQQASVRKIADRVGVAMSVVLYHFGNKDELVLAIVSHLYRSLIEIMLPAVESEPSAAGKLAAHVRAHTGYIATHLSHQVALMEIAGNYRSSTGQRVNHLSIDPALLADLMKVDLEPILQNGVDDGEFRPMSTESMALAVRGAIGTAVLQATSNSAFDVRAYGEDLVITFELATTNR